MGGSCIESVAPSCDDLLKQIMKRAGGAKEIIRERGESGVRNFVVDDGNEKKLK